MSTLSVKINSVILKAVTKVSLVSLKNANLVVGTSAINTTPTGRDHIQSSDLLFVNTSDTATIYLGDSVSQLIPVGPNVAFQLSDVFRSERESSFSTGQVFIRSSEAATNVVLTWTETDF